MYKEMSFDHNEIFRKKSSITYNGREMVVIMKGLRCAPDPEMKVTTQELTMAVAMKLIQLHQKHIKEGTLPSDLDPDYFMEHLNRGWLQSYMMIPLANSISKLAPAFKDQEFNIIFKFQYFRKTNNVDNGYFIYDRSIQVDAYQGTEENRTKVYRLADDKYTARFREHHFVL